MPTVDQEQIESIVSEATATGRLQPEKARIMQQFLAQINERARVIYDAAMTLSAQMYDRQQIAQFWKGQREIFEAQLAIANGLKRKIRPSGDPRTQELLVVLEDVTTTLEDLVSATSEHYEFHA